MSGRCASAGTGSSIRLPDTLSNPQPLDELRPPLDNLLFSLFFPLLFRMLLSFEVGLKSHVSIANQNKKNSSQSATRESRERLASKQVAKVK
jgi:hypothetical protein